MAQRMKRLNAVSHEWKLVTLSRADNARGRTSKAGPPTPSAEMARENRGERSTALALATWAVEANMRSNDTNWPRAMRRSKRLGSAGKVRGGCAIGCKGAEGSSAKSTEAPAKSVNVPVAVVSVVVVIGIPIEVESDDEASEATTCTNWFTDCCRAFICC